MSLGLYAQDLGRAMAVRGRILEAAAASVTTLAWYDLSSPPNANAVLLPTQGSGAGLINVSVEGVFVGTVTIYLSNTLAQPPATPLARFYQLGQTIDAPAAFKIESPWRWIAAGFARTSGTVDAIDIYGILGRP